MHADRAQRLASHRSLPGQAYGALCPPTFAPAAAPTGRAQCIQQGSLLPTEPGWGPAFSRPTIAALIKFPLRAIGRSHVGKQDQSGFGTGNGAAGPAGASVRSGASRLRSAATGLVTAATGVFVVPAVPYLAALGLGKEDLVQALGLSFTVSTLALALGLVGGRILQAHSSGPRCSRSRRRWPAWRRASGSGLG